MNSYINALTSDASTPLAKVVYIAEKDFFPQVFYERSIKNVMTMLNPSKSGYLFRTIQALYKETPGRFSIHSGLHQNDETDVLHYSIRVQLEHSCCMLLHFNGFFKNMFIVRNITVVEHGERKVVADFVRYQDETL